MIPVLGAVESEAAPQLSRGRVPYTVRWLAWTLLALAAAAGLGRLRVSNSLEAWSPDRASRGATGTYLVLGFDTRDIDPSGVEAVVRDQPGVAWYVGPDSTLELVLAGATPVGLVTSERGDYAGVYCFARPGLGAASFYRKLVDALSALAPERPQLFSYSGPAAFAHALDEASRRRMPLMLVLITLLGGTLMWGVSRSARVAVASVGALSLSLIILLGAAGWLSVPVDMSLLLVPPMMISLGYSYAAHAALRRDATRVLAVCGLTTVLGIGAFGATSIESIRTFALWGAGGVALVWFCAVSLVPPGLAMLGGPARAPDRWFRLRVLSLVRRGQRWLVIAGLAIAVLGAITVPRLAINPQPLNYFSQGDRIVHDNAELESRLTGMLPFEVVASKLPDMLEMLRQSPLVRKVIDITRFGNDGGHTLWCLADNGSLDALEVAFRHWNDRARERGQTLRVQGVAPQLLEVRTQMRRVAGASIPAMLLVAAAATGILGGSLRAAMIGVFVTLIPLAGVVALAGWLHWPMQMPTLMVGAIGIGAGVDDAIHVFWLRRQYSVARACAICLRPCAGSSLIAAACMGVFMISPFRPTAQFGMLMALILAFASVADLIVLPVLLVGRKMGPRSRECPGRSARRRGANS